MDESNWSKTEKETARRAFQAAYQRECEVITAKLKEMAASVSEPADIWRIHDYLTGERKRTDEKYDYRYSVLMFMFAGLLNEGWLKESDLAGLHEDKIEKIKYLIRLNQ
jgi:hypothetical protein